MPVTIRAPFGASDKFVLAATGTTALTIYNRGSVIDGSTIQLTGAATINLTNDVRLEVGATINLKATFVGITTLTFGTGFICPAITGAAGKTFTATFYYDGVNFLPIAAPYQIN